jgi:hypothetical protein
VRRPLVRAAGLLFLLRAAARTAGVNDPVASLLVLHSDALGAARTARGCYADDLGELGDEHLAVAIRAIEDAQLVVQQISRDALTEALEPRAPTTAEVMRRSIARDLRESRG